MYPFWHIDSWMAISRRQMSTLIGATLMLTVLHLTVFESKTIWPHVAAMAYGILCYWTGRNVWVSCCSNTKPPLDYKLFDKGNKPKDADDD